MNDVKQWLLEVAQEAFEDAADTVEEAVDAAHESMENTIRTSGSRDPWDGDWTGFQDREGKPHRFGSAPGRVHTGRMVGAIDKKVERGNGEASGRVGWLDEGDWADYFQHQEYGFKNVLAGVNVEGMHSLETASQVVEAILSQRGYRE